MDLSGMKKLKALLRRTEVDIGWLSGVNHWSSTPSNPITVPTLAHNLHEYSAWQGQVLFERGDSFKISSVVQDNLRKSLGVVPFNMVATNIGSDLKDLLTISIQNVSTPENSPQWAAIKTFNDPLIYGSHFGNTPNLLSEIKWEVR